MLKSYNLSEYLSEEKAKIVLGERAYEINDGFLDLLKIDALVERRETMSNTEFIKEFLSISLGKEKAEELIQKNYKAVVYSKIMECIQDALAGGEETPSDEKPELV